MKWDQNQKEAWFRGQKIQRSYQEDVCSKIHPLKKDFDIITYGALSLNPHRYPLYFLKSKNRDSKKKTVLITGGVHGYETSGVQGALEFLRTSAQNYLQDFNVVCAPCISPWAYETINRWSPLALDPNRSFHPESLVEECALFLKMIEEQNIKPFAHFDLHETTDSDNTIFLPTLSLRDGVPVDIWEIPDGFYLVGDTEKPQKDFEMAIINSVKKVTHIAPQDKEGKIIGVPIQAEGVIYYPLRKLSLCAGFSSAKFVTTTEVYPDSPKVTPDLCIKAQVTAINAGLDFLCG